ncbi:rhodanese-like domain-containing protein [Kaarinaea lacus]
MRGFKLQIVFLLFLIMFVSSVGADEGFPGRQKFPDVPYIQLEDLFQRKNDVVIVDARSQYEFETLRIKGAVNIPIANKNFESKLLQLRKSTSKAIIFYCNGHRCMKSYQAVKKAWEVQVQDVYAFDAGIFDWTRAYPKHAVLLGKSPVNPKKLIASRNFEARLLDPDKFSESILHQKGKSIVIDVRDKFQRSGIGFYPGLEKWASLDDRKKLNRYIQQAKRENKTLFIYDEVGKQVRWLQYALEKAGVRNYYFMDKGARAYYDLLAKLEWQ